MYARYDTIRIAEFECNQQAPRRQGITRYYILPKSISYTLTKEVMYHPLCDKSSNLKVKWHESKAKLHA